MEYKIYDNYEMKTICQLEKWALHWSGLFCFACIYLNDLSTVIGSLITSLNFPRNRRTATYYKPFLCGITSKVKSQVILYHIRAVCLESISLIKLISFH